jgi:predicted RNase H-like nuclease
MAADPYYLGVDWARGGWMVVVFDRQGFDHAAVHPEIGDVWTRYEDAAARIFVDVPIGLQTSGAERRQCDEQARGVLGPRSAAVFTPPVREATRKSGYRAASRANERKTGRGLSKQAFAISEGIVAVDDLLATASEARGVVAESHPEVCFRAFAGEPLSYSKRTAAGFAERLDALAAFEPDAPATVREAAAATGDHEVAVDDVVDAVALAVTARPGRGDLHSLPPDPPVDDRGLPKRIVYRAAHQLDASA